MRKSTFSIEEKVWIVDQILALSMSKDLYKDVKNYPRSSQIDWSKVPQSLNISVGKFKAACKIIKEISTQIAFEERGYQLISSERLKDFIEYIKVNNINAEYYFHLTDLLRCKVAIKIGSDLINNYYTPCKWYKLTENNTIEETDTP